jgi:hypothetical protein
MPSRDLGTPWLGGMAKQPKVFTLKTDPSQIQVLISDQE